MYNITLALIFIHNLASLIHSAALLLLLLLFLTPLLAQGGAAPHGRVLAKFEDSLPVAVEDPNRLTLSINIFPVCRDHDDGGWNSYDCNGAELFANALLYLGARSMAQRRAFPF